MKKVIGILMVSVLLLTLGINYVYGQEVRVEKVVLQDNVQTSTDKERQVSVSVDNLDLKLPQGEYFSPGFYIGDEVYGEVGIDVGLVQDSIKFPVNGTAKDSLYKVGKDSIISNTEKTVFTHVYGSKVIGYGNQNNTTNVYSMDYLKDEEPQLMEKLTEQLNNVIYDTKNLFIREYRDENKTLLYIYTILPYRGTYIYIYDVEGNKLYSKKGNTPSEHGVNYSKALNTFFYIDNNLVVYKMEFENNEYDFKEYMDLKPYYKEAIDISSIAGVMYNTLNDDEILITTKLKFNNEGYFSFHPINVTKSLSIFNLRTNQYKEIYIVEDNKIIDTTYIEHFETLDGYLVVFNEYEDSNGALLPKEREFKLISSGELKTLYKEDIREEGVTYSPMVRVIVKGDEGEIFLTKSITGIKNNIETTERVIYKKYFFK